MLKMKIGTMNRGFLKYALIRIYDKINLDKIAKLIDKIDIISNISKEFYKKFISNFMKLKYNLKIKVDTKEF